MSPFESETLTDMGNMLAVIVLLLILLRVHERLAIARVYCFTAGTTSTAPSSKQRRRDEAGANIQPENISSLVSPLSRI